MSIHNESANCYSSPDIGLPEFIPVKVRLLFPGSALPCDFYSPSLFEEEIRLDKMMDRREFYLEENQCTLLEEENDVVYIKTGDEQTFLAYLSDKTHEALKSQEMPDKRKIQLLYDSAEAVV